MRGWSTGPKGNGSPRWCVSDCPTHLSGFPCSSRGMASERRGGAGLSAFQFFSRGAAAECSPWRQPCGSGRPHSRLLPHFSPVGAAESAAPTGPRRKGNRKVNNRFPTARANSIYTSPAAPHTGRSEQLRSPPSGRAQPPFSAGAAGPATCVDTIGSRRGLHSAAAPRLKAP